MRERLVWLGIAVVGCGSTSTANPDASGSFGGSPDARSDSRDAPRDSRDATSDGNGNDARLGDARAETGRSADAHADAHRDAGSSDAALSDASLDGPLYYATCEAACASPCAGVCSGGNCLDVLATNIDSDSSGLQADSHALYWPGPPLGDASPFDYTLWRDPSDGTGTPSIVASFGANPDAGFLLLGPVAGGFGGAFFTTIGATPSGPGRLFGAWPDAGMQLLYAPDSGTIDGVAVNDGGLYASRTSGSTSDFVSIPINGAAPTLLYADMSVLAEQLAVNRKSFASILLNVVDRSFAGIVTGALDGSTPLVKIAQGVEVGGGMLALDATYVYWFGPGATTGYTEPSTIYRAPISGGPRAGRVHRRVRGG